MGLATLASLYPWPQVTLEPTTRQGWFGAGNARLLGQLIGPDTDCIVELGSWLGASAGWILEHSRATLVCIDHWKGSAELLETFADQLPTLYEQFLANLAEYQGRLIPIRKGTIDGLIEVAKCGVKPNLIYIDAAHDETSVMSDLCVAFGLFPQARICGDDWGWDSVRGAVDTFARQRGLTVTVDDNAWALM